MKFSLYAIDFYVNDVIKRTSISLKAIQRRMKFLRWIYRPDSLRVEREFRCSRSIYITYIRQDDFQAHDAPGVKLKVERCTSDSV